MIVELCRSSGTWAESPDPAAFKGKRHGGLQIWLVEVDSLEDVVRRWGTVVLSLSDEEGITYQVEIYDDYRE